MNHIAYIYSIIHLEYIWKIYNIIVKVNKYSEVKKKEKKTALDYLLYVNFATTIIESICLNCE
jgi:hypothetical protein